MHMYADHMLGGLAIVGGHVPIATGAAFTIKYLKEKEVSLFLLSGRGRSGPRRFPRIAQSRRSLESSLYLRDREQPMGHGNGRSARRLRQADRRKLWPKLTGSSPIHSMGWIFSIAMPALSSAMNEVSNDIHARPDRSGDRAVPRPLDFRSGPLPIQRGARKRRWSAIRFILFKRCAHRAQDPDRRRVQRDGQRAERDRRRRDEVCRREPLARSDHLEEGVFAPEEK